MDDLYLIAHKVRGQPTFDVATRVQIGDEEGWIIPTSGHRAYPYWHEELRLLIDWPMQEINGNPLPAMPPDLEDHYPAPRAPDAPKPTAAGLLAALGLGKPKLPTVQRRI